MAMRPNGTRDNDAQKQGGDNSCDAVQDNHGWRKSQWIELGQWM
jgi:hypothetical protein